MSKVDILAVLDAEISCRRIAVANGYSSEEVLNELEETRAAVAELIEALEVAQGGLHMLKKAIEARDPWSELLVRATDTERDLRTALASVRSTK